MARSHSARFRYVAASAFALALLISPGVVAESLVSLRSAGASLPESIARESLAAVARTIDSVAWSAGADDTAALLSSVARAVADTFSPVLPEALQIRLLSASNSRSLSPGEAVLALSAGESGADGWDRLAQRRLPSDPSPAQVAARAVARLYGATFRSDGADSVPRRDVLAHIRWLEARLQLSSPIGSRVAGPDGADPLDPETAFLVVMLASGVPRRTFSADDGDGLFPPDWRTRVADRLLAAQIDSPGEGPHWEDSSGNTARATAFAVIALSMLAL